MSPLPPSHLKYTEEFRKSIARRIITEGPGTEKGLRISEILKDTGVSDASARNWALQYKRDIQDELAREAVADAVQQKDGLPEDYEEIPLEEAEFPDIPLVSTVSVTMDIPTFLLPLSDDQLERMSSYITEKLRAAYGRTE